jgi:hypothetical protein
MLAGGCIMRKAMLLPVPDPIIGTWKLNIAKSKIPQSDTAPKETTDIYRDLDTNQIEFSRTGTRMDGSLDTGIWKWPREGGIAERTSPSPLPEGLSYIELLINPGHWYVTILQDGKQKVIMHKAISKDGKTMRLKVKGINVQGKPFKQLQVFEKQ